MCKNSIAKCAVIVPLVVGGYIIWKKLLEHKRLLAQFSKADAGLAGQVFGVRD